MNQAQQRAIAIAKKVLARLSLRAGQREREVAAWIEQELKKSGARPAFRTIVGSGKRSAIPHCYATGKRIRKGEMVIVDFGALYNGYRSDVTRTYFVGAPTSRQKKIFRIVAEAQRRAIRAVKAGVPCFAVDRAARDYIKSQEHGRFFIHTTGHGVGKKVHQAPKISLKNRNKLQRGQVITIEPGIYLKGWGGCRIEDMVLVTAKGRRVLTR